MYKIYFCDGFLGLSFFSYAGYTGLSLLEQTLSPECQPPGDGEQTLSPEWEPPSWGQPSQVGTGRVQMTGGNLCLHLSVIIILIFCLCVTLHLSI